MLEIPERVHYGEWDKFDFIIPAELQLTDNSFLREAIQFFIKRQDVTERTRCS